MKKIRITLPEEFAFSQENAARLVQTLSRFDSSIMIQENNKSVNAKSLLGILSLAYLQPSSLEFLIDGSDEDKAIEALKRYFDVK